MDEMYSAMPGSPITHLVGDISAGQTTIAVADDTALPDAPNICTIGYGEHIETIRYGAKSNGVLQDVTRGIEGTPRAWQSGTEVARFYTAYDHNAIIQTIMTHKADMVTQRTDITIASNYFIPGAANVNYVTYNKVTKMCELNAFLARSTEIAGGTWYDVGFKTPYKPSRDIVFAGIREGGSNAKIEEVIKCKIDASGFLWILLANTIPTATQYKIHCCFYAI